MLKKFDKLYFLCYNLTCHETERMNHYMKKFIGAALVTLSITAVAAAASADSAGVVSADATYARQGAGDNFKAVETLSAGEIVSIVSEENSWYKIDIDGEYAYVYSGDVSDNWQNTVEENVKEYKEEKEKAEKNGENVLEYSKGFIGVPYVYGGTTPSGFDCSGFVKYVYAKFGISLPRTSYQQMACGTDVTGQELRAGDLLFFNGGSHVGIYAGNGTYIHAPRTGRNVSIDPLNREVCAARRIF